MSAPEAFVRLIDHFDKSRRSQLPEELQNVCHARLRLDFEGVEEGISDLLDGAWLLDKLPDLRSHSVQPVILPRCHVEDDGPPPTTMTSQLSSSGICRGFMQNCRVDAVLPM